MGSRIFIDGYNFLWASDRHRPEAIRDFESAREEMLARLSGHPLLARHQVRIVFDAYKTDSLDRSTETRGDIEVQYSRGGETADQVLKQLATEFGNGAIVISSDREVARFAEKKGCGVLGSHEFDRLLNEEGLRDDEEEDEYVTQNRKGPSHRLPKARRQALNRLRR